LNKLLSGFAVGWIKR